MAESTNASKKNLKNRKTQYVRQWFN